MPLRAAAAAPAAPVLPFRVGHGFDLHRLELCSENPDLKLILGGMAWQNLLKMSFNTFANPSLLS